MRTMFSEALPATLSCIFHANAQHIVKCKKSILIDSSWNGTITFQIYKGNETRRFLRDSRFTVRVYYFKDPVSPSVFAPKLFLFLPLSTTNRDYLPTHLLITLVMF